MASQSSDGGSGSSGSSGGGGAPPHWAAGKMKAVGCTCTDEQKAARHAFQQCAWCCDQDGVKREKTETDSGWDGTSPNRDDAVKHVLTPRTNATTESEVSTPADQNVGNLADAGQDDDPDAAPGIDYGSSNMTTPKFKGQTEPAYVIEGYSPTRAIGQELKDRKAGEYKRTRAECGDDDTPKAYKNNPDWRRAHANFGDHPQKHSQSSTHLK